MLHMEGRGGTPYGATTIAGPKGELAPTAEDLAICRVQGKRVAEITKKIRNRGRSLNAPSVFGSAAALTLSLAFFGGQTI